MKLSKKIVSEIIASKTNRIVQKRWQL